MMAPPQKFFRRIRFGRRNPAQFFGAIEQIIQSVLGITEINFSVAGSEPHHDAEVFTRRASTFSKKIEIRRQTLAPYFLSQNFAVSTRSDVVVWCAEPTGRKLKNSNGGSAPPDGAAIAETTEQPVVPATGFEGLEPSALNTF